MSSGSRNGRRCAREGRRRGVSGHDGAYRAGPYAGLPRLVLAGRDKDVVFTGDAAKNRAELISRNTDMTYDAAISRASIEMIWSHWRRKPGTCWFRGTICR